MTIRTIIFSIIIGFLFSCSSNERQKNGEISSSNNFKKLKKALSFSGYWVSEDYFNSIRDFKSPMKAQDGSNLIVIPESTLKQTKMFYNFHEGRSNLKILLNNGKYELWEVQENILTRCLHLIDVSSPTKIKIGDKPFIKINPKDEYLILEDLLFKGLYFTPDGKIVEFKNNGQITGLDNFHYYKPVIDYYEPGMQVDQIGLSNSEKDFEWFGFKFNKDTLDLYKLNYLTSDSTEVGFGQLTYKLIRKK